MPFVYVLSISNQNHKTIRLCDVDIIYMYIFVAGPSWNSRVATPTSQEHQLAVQMACWGTSITMGTDTKNLMAAVDASVVGMFLHLVN